MDSGSFRPVTKFAFTKFPLLSNWEIVPVEKFVTYKLPAASKAVPVVKPEPEVSFSACTSVPVGVYSFTVLLPTEPKGSPIVYAVPAKATLVRRTADNKLHKVFD